MASIGFVVHAQREGAATLASDTCSWLREGGHFAEILDTDRPAVAAGLDLAVSLGGDGTMLRTVDLASPDGVPVLGVNLGHLGYLTVAEPDGLREALRRFLAGDYQVESRMTLDVSLLGGNDGSHTVLHRSALNDVVLQRPAGHHTIRTEVSVDKVPFMTFVADALILATPTGSTAYNLSARGPIVSPRARVQVLTPVAPHMLFDRSLVLDGDDEVSIVALGGQQADVVIDGWPVATLEPGRTLQCRRGGSDARLVTFGERDFHHILKRKFNLADR
ncbi:MAG: NAD(+)/NADH kinase [Acidimicrobiales bacterium]